MGKKTRKRPRWRRLSFEYVNEERSTSPVGDEQVNCDQLGHDQNTRGHAVSTHMFDENEYTKIQTPRQDMIFKKNVFSNRPRDNSSPTSVCDGLSCCDEWIGEGGLCDPSSCPYPYSPYPPEFCTSECCQGAPYVPFPASQLPSVGLPYLPNLSVPPPPLMLEVPEQQVFMHMQPLAAGEHLSFTAAAPGLGGKSSMVSAAAAAAAPGLGRKGSVVSAAAAAVAHQVVMAARGRAEDMDSVEGDVIDGNEGVSDSELCREEDEASLAKLLAEIQYAFIDPHGNIFCNVMDDAGMIHLPAVAGYHMNRPFPCGPMMATPVPWQAVAIAPLASPSYRLLQYMSPERIRQLQLQLEARILLQCHHFQQLLMVEHQRQLHTRLPFAPEPHFTKYQIDSGYFPSSQYPYHTSGSVDETCLSESSNSDDHVTVTTTTPVDFTRPPPPPLYPVTYSSTSGVVSMSDHSDLVDTPATAVSATEDSTAVEEASSQELDKPLAFECEEDSVLAETEVTGGDVRNDLTTLQHENNESKESNYKSRRMKKKKKKKQKKRAKKCAENSPVRRSIDSGIIDEGSDASRESSQQASADTASSINSDPTLTSTGHSQSGQTSGIQSDMSTSSSPPDYSSDSDADTLLSPTATSQQLNCLAQNLESYSGRSDKVGLQLDKLSGVELQLRGAHAASINGEAESNYSADDCSNMGEVVSVPHTDAVDPLNTVSNSSSFSSDSSSSSTVVMEEVVPVMAPVNSGDEVDSECVEGEGSLTSSEGDEQNGEGEESCDSIIFDTDPRVEDDDSWNESDRPVVDASSDLPIIIDLKKTVILEETESEQESYSQSFLTESGSCQDTSKECSVEPESSYSNSPRLESDVKLENPDHAGPTESHEEKQSEVSSITELPLEESPRPSSSIGVEAPISSVDTDCALHEHPNSVESHLLPRSKSGESGDAESTVTATPLMPISEAIRNWVSLQSPEVLFSAVDFQSEEEATEDDAANGCDSCSEAIEWDESKSQQVIPADSLPRWRRTSPSACSLQ